MGNLLDYLRKNKLINIYIIRGLINNVKGFTCEVEYDDNKEIMGVVAIWEEEKIATIRGEEDFCRHYFYKLIEGYDLYDLEKNIIEDLERKKHIELRNKKISHYYIMTCSTRKIKDNNMKVKYFEIDLTTWKKIAKLYKDKYDIEFTEFQPENMVWLVVYEKDNPISTICLEKIEDDVYVISNFYTSPQRRSEGIGKKLLNAVLDDYERCKFILFVDKENRRVVELYKSFGFETYSELANVETR